MKDNQREAQLSRCLCIQIFELNFSSIYRHKRDNSPEIYNYQNLMKAYDKLGHIKSKIPSPDFKRQSSIDKSEEIKSKRKMMSLYSILNKTAKAMVD